MPFPFHFLSSECPGILDMSTMFQNQDTLHAPEQPPAHNNSSPAQCF